MGFAGLGFVIFSQTGGINSEGNAISTPDIILGVFFALLAAGIAALASADSIRWSITFFDFGVNFYHVKKRRKFLRGCGLYFQCMPTWICEIIG